MPRKKDRVYYKKFRLTPMHFDCEVIVCGNFHKACKAAAEITGSTIDEWYKNLESTSTASAINYEDPEGCTRLMIVSSGFFMPVMIHESVHIVWYLDKLTGLGISHDNQEIHAYLIEYMYEEILEMSKNLDKYLFEPKE